MINVAEYQALASAFSLLADFIHESEDQENYEDSKAVLTKAEDILREYENHTNKEEICPK